MEEAIAFTDAFAEEASTEVFVEVISFTKVFTEETSVDVKWK